MRKARSPRNKLKFVGQSGYRSEATMNFRPFLLIAFTAVLSANIVAQNKINPSHLSLRTAAGVERSSFAPDSETSAASLMALEQDTFQLINVERGLAGLPALKWNEKVAKLARLHSQNMADHNFFSHKGSDGSMVDARADKLGLGNWQAIGENIAFMKGFQDPAANAVEKWLLSASHKNNMMSPQWSDSAIGVAMTEDGKVYFTQVFLLKN